MLYTIIMFDIYRLEFVMNTINEYASHTKILFNTSLVDILDTIKRSYSTARSPKLSLERNISQASIRSESEPLYV